ncbi:putative zinc-binding protein [Desulfotalea psychrophila]|uniref:Zinc-binding protein n=1 Tax=Desulfotalea psychrophila (strain LSv54 / DSM 12343) TaxID=177439 RepID=Q6APP8_DESPS|nr:putative zinc-binding protein [Desulfotalea psychrophila]CAG35676.1 hypothetical protein DP0947 [Desulfotalea psychrophila LSv54]
MLQTIPTCGCSCNSSASRLIFSCSGCHDVGDLSDRVARKMEKDGLGKMACLAGIGGRVSGLMMSAEAASAIVAIDGCALNCAQKTLSQAGFDRVTHLCLADLAFKIGGTEVTDEAIARVVQHVNDIS